MTTNTTSTASQALAVSINTEEFRKLVSAYMKYADSPDMTSGHCAWSQLIGHIEAQMVKDHNRVYTAGYAAIESRATAAEAKLEMIRQGVEDLLEYILDHDWGGIPEPVPQIAALRALFQPQPQADESGLPG